MNEQELAGKIVQRLEQGLGELKQGNLYRLQIARKAALDRYNEAPSGILGWAWAGNFAHFGQSRYLNVRYLLPLALLVLSLLGAAYFGIQLNSSDIADIDANLLTGDLPIDAYLDSEFEAWLKRSWE